ncbi:MAG TPA: hypothetical protein VEZ90_12250 [Blastocatellia bacterium]|nr:hypothetical protein [Blastocatellia bacterium]
MTKLRKIAFLVVVAHWIDAIWHLFLAAKILPAPNNSVSPLAVTLISLGHLCVLLALWKLKDRLAGSVSVIFFLAALSADVYEHFLQAAPNNVRMVAPGDWSALFIFSVIVLLVLEIAGCSLGVVLSGGAGKRFWRRTEEPSHEDGVEGGAPNPDSEVAFETNSPGRTHSTEVIQPASLRPLGVTPRLCGEDFLQLRNPSSNEASG